MWFLGAFFLILIWTPNQSKLFCIKIWFILVHLSHISSKLVHFRGSGKLLKRPTKSRFWPNFTKTGKSSTSEIKNWYILSLNHSETWILGIYFCFLHPLKALEYANCQEIVYFVPKSYHTQLVTGWISRFPCVWSWFWGKSWLALRPEMCQKYGMRFQQVPLGQFVILAISKKVQICSTLWAQFG